MIYYHFYLHTQLFFRVEYWKFIQVEEDEQIAYETFYALIQFERNKLHCKKISIHKGRKSIRRDFSEHFHKDEPVFLFNL